MIPSLFQRPLLYMGITLLAIILIASQWTQLHQLEMRGDFSNFYLESQMSPTKQDIPVSRGQGSESSVNPSNDVHIVFSTDCSGYQHWQAIALYYSFRRAGYLGAVTRIVSGCKPSQEEEIRTEFEKIQQNSNNQQLRLHFTPSFELIGYKYSNKAGGMHHWIMNHTTLEESVIALVDPDMMALRPIVPQLGEGMSATSVTRDGFRNLVEYRDEHEKVLLLRQNRLPKLPSRVAKGVAAGQHFGVGGFWASSGTKNAPPDFREFNLTMVCGADSPCLNVPRANQAYTTRELADKNYAVGPVYIASTSDWMDLLPRWAEFTPRVRFQYPKLVAEMYAFSMAAADLQLNFSLSSSYMVSDPNTMSTTEGWLWIDDYANRDRITIATPGVKQRPIRIKPLRSVCDGATANSLPAITLRRLENYGYGNYRGSDASIPADKDGGPLPTVLHYCQNYNLANHTFAKRKMPHDFFRCDGEPLKFDVEALMDELDLIENNDGMSATQKKKQMRTGFMLCHLVPLMNMALIDYKLDVCGNN